MTMKYWWFLFVVGVCFWAIRPLFQPGFFPMHDDEQIARLFDLNQALQAGHIPPRIAPNLGFGYGYPFFNFYPAFAYYVAEIFKLIGFSYIESTKIMIGLGFILSSFFMYLLSKEFFGKLGGLISAIAYVYAPYHSLDVYVRGALPEFWSFVFLPAIFWSFYELDKTHKRRFFIFSTIFSACLILTHNLVALMAGPFILAYLIFIILKSKNKRRFLISGLSVVFFAFSLTCFFWLPSFFEKKFTMVDILTTELANYNLHFVYIRQFWDSPWGYGGSIYGLYDGLSFQIGKIHIILSFLAIFLALILFKLKNKNWMILSLFVLLLFFSLFMQTFHSKFIWDIIQPLWYVQFPWRFLIFSAFFSSLLAGSITLVPFTRNIRVFLAIIVAFLLVALNVNYFKPAKYFLSVKDSDYTNQEKIRWDTSKLAAEYVPKGIATRKSDINTTLIDIDRIDIAKQSYSVISGEMKVKEIQNLPQEKKYSLSANKESVMRINTYSFPGWKIYMDGKQISYTDNNKLKLITLKIPVGSHTLISKFTNTTVRGTGNWISLISIITLIFIWLCGYPFKRRSLL